MSEGKDDGNEKEKPEPKPIKTWPFPRDMESDFAMLEAKSDEINNLKREAVEMIQRVEKQQALLRQMAESTWDQVKEALVEQFPDDEKILFTCAGLHVVKDEKLNIHTEVEAYMPDGAPKELIDEDDVTKVNLTLREAGTDDKTGAASGPSTTNAEEMMRDKWKRKHGEAQDETPEVPDEFPDELKLDDSE